MEGFYMKPERRGYHRNINFDEIDELIDSKSKEFKRIFQEELVTQSASEDFMEELKHVQVMVMNGKLNPKFKATLIEWKEVFPNRFENFCEKLSLENRQKLNNFLKL